MNRALIKRLLNEYLDGEIGLADKVELEQLMAADPNVRREYKELRQLGMLIGAVPEVAVHPSRFRGRVQDALDGNARFFTPQRAFAGAMLVALVVITISFSLLMFQQGLPRNPGAFEAQHAPAVSPGSYIVTLDAGVSADRFFSRLLLEHELGMVDPQALNAVLAQTTVFEGASCNSGDQLNAVRLANPNLPAVRLKVSPSVATQLSKVAEELSGRSAPLGVYGSDHSRLTLEQFLRLNPGQHELNLQLKFR